VVLKRLEIKRFKCHRHRVVEFSPGLNVIRGPNESGKSSLREALLFALFGNPTSQSEAIQRLTTWGAKEAFELKLEYWDAAGRLCQLRKDFAGKKVFLLRGEESLQTPKGVQNEVGEALGIENEEFFTLCASLDVRSLAHFDPKTTRRVGQQMVAGMLTGTANGTDILQTIKQLEEALKDLRKGLSGQAKSPGPLKAAREEWIRAQAAWQSEEQNLQARQGRQNELEKITAEVERLEEHLQNLDALLEANRKMNEAEQRLSVLKQADNRFDEALRRRRQWEEEFNTLDRGLAADPVAGFTREQIQEMDACQEKLSGPAPADDAKLPNSGLWFFAGAALFLLGWVLVWKWTAAGLLAILGGALAAVFCWRSWREARTAWQQRRRDQEGQRSEWTRRLQSFLDRARAANAAGLHQRWVDLQEPLARRRVLEQQLREAPTDESSWQEVRREIRLVQDQLQAPETAGRRLTPIEVTARERERKQASAALEEKRRQRERLRVLLEHDASSSDRLRECEEKSASWQERIAYLEARERVGQIALEAMVQARDQTLHPEREVLQTRAGELLGIFTGGRYRRVRVSEDDLISRVYVPASGRWEDPQLLSQGTQDQFYLSLRLALADILAGGKRIPFFLDEPLAAFDPERQALALDWLRKLAPDRQILFFTCRPDYDTIGHNVIVLGQAEE